MKSGLHGKQSAVGFSLIELLVVMAVILLLLRLLLPSLEKARGHAYRVQCTSNLRQLGTAFMLYTSEYRYYPTSAEQGSDQSWEWARQAPGGTLPMSCAPIGTGRGTGYESTLGTYANPSDKPCRESVYWCPVDSATATNLVISYSMNEGINGGNLTTPMKAIDMLYPSGTYLLLEECRSGGDCNSGTGDSSDGNYRFNNPGNRASMRHLEGSNALFADGHVKWYQKGSDTQFGTLDYDTYNDFGSKPIGDNGDAGVDANNTATTERNL